MSGGKRGACLSHRDRCGKPHPVLKAAEHAKVTGQRQQRQQDSLARVILPRLWGRGWPVYCGACTGLMTIWSNLRSETVFFGSI